MRPDWHHAPAMRLPQLVTSITDVKGKEDRLMLKPSLTQIALTCAALLVPGRAAPADRAPVIRRTSRTQQSTRLQTVRNRGLPMKPNTKSNRRSWVGNVTRTAAIVLIPVFLFQIQTAGGSDDTSGMSQDKYGTLLQAGTTIPLGGRTATIERMDVLPYVQSEFTRRFRFDSSNNPSSKSYASATNSTRSLRGAGTSSNDRFCCSIGSTTGSRDSAVPRPDKKFLLERGRWYRLEIMVKANRPEHADGGQAFWVDGKLIGHFRGIKLKSRASLWLCLCAVLLLVSPSDAQVYNLHLVTDSQPDYTHFESFVQSSTGTWKTPEEKATAVWRWGRRSRH